MVEENMKTIINNDNNINSNEIEVIEKIETEKKVLKKRGRKPKNKDNINENKSIIESNEPSNINNNQENIEEHTVNSNNQNKGKKKKEMKIKNKKIIENFQTNGGIINMKIYNINSNNNNENEEIEETDKKQGDGDDEIQDILEGDNHIEELVEYDDNHGQELVEEDENRGQEIGYENREQEMVDENRGQKKRGRKPKEKTYNIIKEDKMVIENVDLDIHLILHLPISMKDIQEEITMTDRDILQYNPNLSEPQPYESSEYLSYESIQNVVNKNINEIEGMGIEGMGIEGMGIEGMGIEMVNDKKWMNIFQDKKVNTLVMGVSMPLNNQRGMEGSITQMQYKPYIDNDMNEYKMGTNNFVNNIFNDNQKKKIIQIMFEFNNDNINNNKYVWPLATNIYCMWCCHPFEWTPCAIPQSYINGKFMVSGCYCSFGCAAAHIFDERHPTMWEKYSLLNLMYKKMYNQNFTKIQLAPPRRLLKIFGGILTIEEFRDNLQKIYKVIEPPLIPILPKVEENLIDFSVTNKNRNNKKINKIQQIIQNEDHIQTLKYKYNSEIQESSVKGKTLYTYMDMDNNAI
jgi:hypothetical protein